MLQLPVCLYYPLHPGHNTQWPGVSEATSPHLKSVPKLSHSSVTVSTLAQTPGVSCFAPLFQVKPYTCALPTWKP